MGMFRRGTRRACEHGINQCMNACASLCNGPVRVCVTLGQSKRLWRQTARRAGGDRESAWVSARSQKQGGPALIVPSQGGYILGTRRPETPRSYMRLWSPASNLPYATTQMRPPIGTSSHAQRKAHKLKTNREHLNTVLWHSSVYIVVYILYTTVCLTFYFYRKM